MRRCAPRHLASVLAVLASLLLPACGSADSATGPATASRPRQRAGGQLALKKIGYFDHPVYVTGAPGFPRLLFVVEQPGRVEVLSNGHRLGKPFLDIRAQVGYDGAERGLLSIAFPPDYAQSRRFYVYYMDKRGQHRDRRIQAPQRRPAPRLAPSAR